MPGTSDTFTSSNRLDKQPTGGNYNQWGIYLNDNFDLIDDLKDGNLILSMSTQQHTLTVEEAATDEARMASVSLIGSPGGTATVTAPNVEKLTWVDNRFTGGWPAVWTNGTGASVTIPNGVAALIQNDAAGDMRKLIQGGTSGAGLQSIYYPAGAMKPFGTSSATSTTMVCTTSGRPIDCLVFGTSSAQYASISIDQMPKSWDGQNMDFRIFGFGTGTGTGTYEMNFGIAELRAGLTIDRAYTASTNVLLGTEVGTASYDIRTGSATGSVSGGTAAVNAGLSIRVNRNTTSTNQTMSGNFYMTGMLMRYNCTVGVDN